MASLKLMAKKGALFFNARELFVRDNFYFAQRYSSLLAAPLPGFGVIGSLGLAGALLGWRRWQSSLYVYSVLLAQVASCVLIFVLARYRLVAVCCLILFASSFSIEAIRAQGERRKRALIVSVAALIGCAALVHIPFPEFERERGFKERQHRIELRSRYLAELENPSPGRSVAPLQNR
jgi:hypothetical protein